MEMLFQLLFNKSIERSMKYLFKFFVDKKCDYEMKSKQTRF